MNTVSISTSLLQYVIAYLKTDRSPEAVEDFEKNWKEGINNAIPELEATLASANQQKVEPGYRQIAGNPNRTEAGQGPLLTGSEFI
jgi:hypothetical protein